MTPRTINVIMAYVCLGTSFFVTGLQETNFIVAGFGFMILSNLIGDKW